MAKSRKFNTERPRGRLRVQQINLEGTTTQQQFADEADINNIMKRHLGGAPLMSTAAQASGRQPLYLDVSSLDYQHMVNVIADAKQAFLTLPPKLRRYHNNDPYQMVRWLDNPENHEEARKLGLMPPLQPSAGAGEPSPEGSTPEGVGPAGGAAGTGSPEGGQGGNAPK